MISDKGLRYLFRKKVAYIADDVTFMEFRKAILNYNFVKRQLQISKPTYLLYQLRKKLCDKIQ